MLANLTKLNFTEPTQIQEKTLEILLEGKDLFAQAETGSGKTLAFSIPIIHSILQNKTQGIHSLIICPTRELSQQITSVIEVLTKDLDIRFACVIGGEDIEKQIQKINDSVNIIIGTPGRICDLLNQGVIKLENLKSIAFDEVDRLFDMGFKKEIDAILQATSESRQLILFSATNNNEVFNTAYRFGGNPVEVKLNEDQLVVDNIDHSMAMVNSAEKMSLLVGILDKNQDSYAMVFCNTQFQTHLVAEWLMKMNYKAKAISGRLPQNQRTKLMEDFREKKITILVCTDVAARGLDIKDITLVINFDLPFEAENYVHRIGRTGRAGEKGIAISFCAYEDCESLDKISELLGTDIPKFNFSDEDLAKKIAAKPYLDKKTLKVIVREKPVREIKKRKFEPKQFKDDVMDISDYKEKESSKCFSIESYDFAQASKKALSHFMLKDKFLLGHDVVKTGAKKYFLFGPRKVEYTFFVKPIFKRLLTPFFIDLFKKMHLQLFVRIAYVNSVVTIHFSGKDINMLFDNNKDLLFALEHLTQKYLYKYFSIASSLKVKMECHDEEDREAYLVKVAKSAKDKVLEAKKPYTLKPLGPSERRVIHHFFQDDQLVKTTSLGDGKFKQIEISLR